MNLKVREVDPEPKPECISVKRNSMSGKTRSPVMVESEYYPIPRKYRNFA